MIQQKVVAIHQPNFLPWLGFFHKITHCNVFILLDNVQLQKTGGSYSNRVQLAVGGVAQWVTVPIVRNYHGTKAINEIEINYRDNWQEKLLRTVQMNYARAKYFEEIFAMLQSLFSAKTPYLSELNIQGIKVILEGLKIDTTEIILASSIHTASKSTELLIELTKACQGNIYLCGGGASGYQEDDLYEKAGIELRFQSFKHPEYDQLKSPFIAGLSIIDPLMHLGWAGTKELFGAQK